MTILSSPQSFGVRLVPLDPASISNPAAPQDLWLNSSLSYHCLPEMSSRHENQLCLPRSKPIECRRCKSHQPPPLAPGFRCHRRYLPQRISLAGEQAMDRPGWALASAAPSSPRVMVRSDCHESSQPLRAACHPCHSLAAYHLPATSQKSSWRCPSHQLQRNTGRRCHHHGRLRSGRMTSKSVHKRSLLEMNHLAMSDPVRMCLPVTSRHRCLHWIAHLPQMSLAQCGQACPSGNQRRAVVVEANL